MGNIDLETERLRSNSEKIYAHYLGEPASRSGNEDIYTVPWRQDRHPSLRVRTTDWWWFDNSRNENGDVFSFVARNHKLDIIRDFKEVKKLCGEIIGDKSVSLTKPKNEFAIIPIPETAGEPPKPKHTEILYKYYTPTGELSHYIARVVPPTGKKQFIPIAYYQSGWKQEYNSEFYYPYRIEKLKERPNAPVLIVEGEKACHVAEGLFSEFVVLSIQGGAGRIKKNDWQLLKTRDVVIWPDNDKPGREAAEGLKIILNDIMVDSLRVVHVTKDFPAKWDLADEPPKNVNLYNFILNSEIHGREKAKPVNSMEIMDRIFAPRIWVLDGIIPEGLTLLSAPGKIGKTFFCQDLSLSIATGKPFMGIVTEQKRILYIDAESDQRVWKERLSAFGFERGAENLDIFNVSRGWQADEVGIAELEDLIIENDYKVIIFDTLARCIPQARDRKGLDAYQSAVAMLSPIQRFATRNQIAVILIHHTKKGEDGGESYDSASGSRGITGTVETLLTFKREKGENLFRLSITGRHGESKDLSLSRQGIKWVCNGDWSEANAGSDQQKEILKLLYDSPGMTPTQISKALKKSKHSISNILRRMHARGLIESCGNGEWSLPGGEE